MVNIEDIGVIESAATIHAAREATLAVLFNGLTIADRRAQIRAQVQTMGTKRQLVQLAWDIALNQQGFRVAGPTEKSRRGIAYKR